MDSSNCVGMRLYTGLTHCYLRLCLCSDRAGSISTLDSLDFARYSDDGNRETDERVAGKMNHTVRVQIKIPVLPRGNKIWIRIANNRMGIESALNNSVIMFAHYHTVLLL